MKLRVFYSWITNRRVERIVFLLLVCANIGPLFSSPHFPFMDSPAHLYNSGVIWQLLNRNSDFLREYFAFNHVIVPNWISYLIMSPLHAFLAPGAIEKCFLVAYYIGLPLAARYCITSFSPGRGYLAYLSLPIAYNTLSLFSFYNFSMALVCFLICTGYFYRHIVWGQPRFRHYLLLFFLILLVFFSHPVILCITLLLLFLIYLHFLYLTHGFSIRRWFNDKTLNIIIAALPSVILLLLYLRAPTTGKPEYHYRGAGELFQGVLTGNIFTAYGQEEQFPSGVLSMILCTAFFICCYVFFTSLPRYGIRNKSFFLFPATVAILLLYRFMPDSDGMGGFVSLRLCIVLFLMGILFISSITLPKPLLFLLLIGVLGSQFYRVKVYNTIIKSRNRELSAITEQAHYLEPESFVFSFEVDDDWLGGHYHNYLCLDKNVIPLQDYECQTGYFPLVWKDYGKINRLVDDVGNFRNLDRVKKEIKNHTLYYWILGDPDIKKDPVNLELKHHLETNCIRVQYSPICSLYKLK
jgi:hypothetical protein